MYRSFPSLYTATALEGCDPMVHLRDIEGYCISDTDGRSERENPSEACRTSLLYQGKLIGMIPLHVLTYAMVNGGSAEQSVRTMFVDGGSV